MPTNGYALSDSSTSIIMNESSRSDLNTSYGGERKIYCVNRKRKTFSQLSQTDLEKPVFDASDRIVKQANQEIHEPERAM